jgi:hypothetical protein
LKRRETGGRIGGGRLGKTKTNFFKGNEYFQRRKPELAQNFPLNFPTNFEYSLNPPDSENPEPLADSSEMQYSENSEVLSASGTFGDFGTSSGTFGTSSGTFGTSSGNFGNLEPTLEYSEFSWKEWMAALQGAAKNYHPTSAEEALRGAVASPSPSPSPLIHRYLLPPSSFLLLLPPFSFPRSPSSYFSSFFLFPPSSLLVLPPISLPFSVLLLLPPPHITVDPPQATSRGVFPDQLPD